MINLDLINMLPKDHSRNAQDIWQAGNDHLPIPLMSQHVITAADHQRSPYKQDSNFAKRNIFQGPGIEQNEEGTSG